MATLRRSSIFRMLLATSLGSIILMTVIPGVALGLPLVAITRPTNGATVSGVIWIDVAFRSDSNRPITRLEVYIDDMLAREVDLATPMLEGRQSFNWDFSYAAATSHKIGARAIDSANAAAAAQITVQVQNAAVSGPDRIPPVVRIYYPAQGAKLHGQVEVKAEASDNVGVELVYFYIDGRLHKMMMNAPPYVDTWDTSREPDGNHVLEAVAVDGAENEARSAQVTVIVENANMTRMNPGAAGSMLTQGAAPLPTAKVPVQQSAPQPVAAWTPAPVPTPVVPSLTPPALAPAPTIAALQPWEPMAPKLVVPENTTPAVAPDVRGNAVTAVTAPYTGGIPAGSSLLPTPIPSSGSSAPTATKLPDVDPLLPISGPKVAVIVPKATAPGPVPSAPDSMDSLLTISDPLAVSSSRTDQLVAAPAPNNAPRTTAAGLLRPAADHALPTASAGSRTAPKAMAPTLTREMPSTTPATAVAAAPAQTVSSEAVPVTQAAKRTLGPQPVRVAAAPGLSATLSPASSTAPRLTSAARPTVGLAKSSAPVGSIVVPMAPRTSAPGEVTVLPPKTAPSASRASLASVSARRDTGVQVVTPVGAPVPAAATKPIDLRPITAVSPDLKTAPSGLSRITTPAPVAVASKPAPKASQPSAKVAAVSRPAITVAPLSQAVLAEYRGLAVPASRMLAMLPSSDAGRLAADGRITAPDNSSAAVPIAVAKVRDIKIVFDGEVLSLRTAPETRKGISLAPLREIFEKTDGVLYWFPTERKVQAVNKSVNMKLTIGDPKVTVNGEAETLQVAPYLKQGRTMVPLQFIADVLDVKIAFDNGTGQILISSNQF
ncbi:MAG: Ig-like domain-containing protein [Armatimonadota bacterium]